MKRFFAVLLALVFWIQPVYAEEKAELVTVPSAILMEATTGKVIYEKEPDMELAPASVTKVMTLLLIFDAIDAGTIKLEDTVVTSEYAASMGGSQVFLEPGEEQTVETMIKCIAVASANDACVAMSELICGNEAEFVAQMNSRAKGLGMEHTHFENCNGLDADGHVTTARDIAIMSRELITKHPEIENYTTIWMEDITHTTAKGTSTFGLSNTNKLIKQYAYATGLKTGSTSKAGFCLSATARKDDIEMIAVVMAAEDSKKRIADATALLDYGFSKCQKYTEDSAQEELKVPVRRGTSKTVSAMQEEGFTYIDTTGADLNGMERKVEVADRVKAPVSQGDIVGKAVYYLAGEEVGSVNILATESVDLITYKSAWQDVQERFCL